LIFVPRRLSISAIQLLRLLLPRPSHSNFVLLLLLLEPWLLKNKQCHIKKLLLLSN
jgi:hypothetical protein